MLKRGDFDWRQIMAGGCRWFHSGGIFAALSETTADLVVEGMEAAGAAGAIRSFDLNYRAKLWDTIGGLAQGQKMIAQIVKNVDCLIGNEEDLQKGLGIKGPEVTHQSESKLDPNSFFEMIDRAVEKFPNVKVVATTLREVHSTNRHSWAAVLWIDGKRYVSPTCELDVIDRIGGGDGFAAGLIYGLLSGRAPEESLRLGWAHGALLTSFPGDVSMAKLPEVEALAKGGSARVQR
jgi:2-dehydro-3-deoxygluconokinase